jgi:hypothetical protein
MLSICIYGSNSQTKIGMQKTAAMARFMYVEMRFSAQTFPHGVYV